MQKQRIPELPALGRLDDLPEEYRQALHSQNLVPLWPNLRSFLPPHAPLPRTRATAWAYSALRPLLMRAGELTPIEKAERRVLALANPGHGHESMRATSAIYLGMQLLLPGEIAPSHRHTPNAARLIVEGEGAFTAVNGVKQWMSRGDLILTPTGMWHEHGHEGDGPVVWLDILDLPLVHYLEAAYVVEGGPSSQAAHQHQAVYVAPGVVPSGSFRRQDSPYPLIRFAWRDTRAALEGMAATEPPPESVAVTYINPETGGDCQNILGFNALMLRRGERLVLPIRSPACVFHVIEGGVRVEIDDLALQLGQADTCSVPGFSQVTLENDSLDNACFLFVADEAPLHRKLGLYEVREESQPHP